MDLFKGIAIIFMTLAHTYEMHASDEMYMSTSGFIINYFIAGPPGAATFMTIMGVGIWYAAYNKGNREELLAGYIPSGQYKRGIKIFLLGMAISFITCVLFPGIGYILSGDKSLVSFMYSFFACDIYQFAGITLLTFELFRRLKIKTKWILPIGILFSVIGSLLRGVSFNNPIIDTICAYFWGVNTNSYFVFLNWFIFPAVGFALASCLARCTNKTKLYLVTGSIGCILYVIYTICCLKWDIGYANQTENNGMNFYWPTIIDAFFYLAAVMGTIGMFYAIHKLFASYEFPLLNRWSRSLIVMYSIQWLLVAASTVVELVVDTETLSLLPICVITVVIVFLTDRLTVLLNRKKTIKI